MGSQQSNRRLQTNIDERVLRGGHRRLSARKQEEPASGSSQTEKDEIFL
jgi:hypothetical protein